MSSILFISLRYRFILLFNLSFYYPVLLRGRTYFFFPRYPFSCDNSQQGYSVFPGYYPFPQRKWENQSVQDFWLLFLVLPHSVAVEADNIATAGGGEGGRHPPGPSPGKLGKEADTSREHSDLRATAVSHFRILETSPLLGMCCMVINII